MLNKNDILIVSVALNLALLGSSVSLLKARPRPPELTINAAESPKRGSRLAAENSSLGNFVGFRWGQLESTDYRIYIGNLRAVGCPEETVRDIIVAEINKL